MALKPCMECRKEISTDANPCPHCGKNSPHGPSSAARLAVGCLVIAGGFIALLAFAFAVLVGVWQSAEPEESGAGEDTAHAQPAPSSVAEETHEAAAEERSPQVEEGVVLGAEIRVTSAREITKEFAREGDKARSKYAGHPIRVTGEIAWAEQLSTDNFGVGFKGFKSTTEVRALMLPMNIERLRMLKEGYTATVTCQLGELDAQHVMLKGCVLRL